MKQEKNILTQGINGNDGLAIQQLIEQNLKNARFCFLAKITALNGNKISVCEIARRNEKEKNPILNNVLIAQPRSGKWKIEFNLKIGDIGLCVVNDSDLSVYKHGGNSEYLVSTDRNHDLNDAIFLPLSLYTQTATDNIDFIISDENGENLINFKGGNLQIQSKEITHLKAKLFTIQSEQTTLKSVLKNLGDILTGATTETASNHTHSSFNGATKSSLASWKSSLDTLFQS